ncbi:MAG TPA: prepilin-type N-terminal cleavage/methylation domain-containing protein [Longimicrobiales bacterium]
MKRAGMTLIELVVAMTIATMGMTVGYAVYAQITTINERAGVANRELQREAAIRTTLVTWLSNARGDSITDTWRIDSGTHHDLSDDRLTFNVDSAAPLIPRPSQVQLYIDRDETTRERGMVALIVNDRATTRIIEIVPNADKLEVELFLAGRERRMWVRTRSIELRAADARGVRMRLGGPTLSRLMSIPIVASRVL